jgi:hypothetical protein
MSLENSMKRMPFLFFFTFLLSSCSLTGFKSYHCLQFDEEPEWTQVSLDEKSERKFEYILEQYYSNPPKNSFLMNEGNNRKYFWYYAESGETLACVVDNKNYKKYTEGCFADRIIIRINKGGIALKEAGSIACT